MAIALLHSALTSSNDGIAHFQLWKKKNAEKKNMNTKEQNKWKPKKKHTRKQFWMKQQQHCPCSPSSSCWKYYEHIVCQDLEEDEVMEEDLEKVEVDEDLDLEKDEFLDTQTWEPFLLRKKQTNQ